MLRVRMKNMLRFLVNDVHLDMRKFPDQAKELADIISEINKEDPCEECTSAPIDCKGIDKCNFFY